MDINVGKTEIYYENWQVKENNIYLTVISSLPHWNFSGEPGHLPIWLVGHCWSCDLIPHFPGTASDTLPSAFSLCYFKRSKNNIGIPRSSPASESNSHSSTQKSINTPNPEPNEFRPQLRTVPESIPGGINGFFSDTFPSDCTMALGSTQPLVKMSTRNIPGGTGGQCVRLTTSPPSCAECHQNLGA